MVVRRTETRRVRRYGADPWHTHSPRSEARHVLSPLLRQQLFDDGGHVSRSDELVAVAIEISRTRVRPSAYHGHRIAVAIEDLQDDGADGILRHRTRLH